MGGDRTSTEQSCESIRPLLPVAALGALEAEDEDAVARHLAGCRRCRHEFTDYCATVDALALTVPLRTPPAELRSRILDAIHPRRRLIALAPRAAAAIAAVLVVALLASNVFLWRELSAARADARPAGRGDAVAAVPTLVWYDLAGDAPQPEARGTLCAEPNGRIAWLIVEGLPPLPPGRVYQAWLVRGDDRTSAGLFSVDERGRGFLTIRLDQPLRSFQAMGVTDEPDGGSPGPTGQRFLFGTLT